MRRVILIPAAVFCAATSFCQVQLDKPLQFSGSGADAKISGIDDVSAPQDAVNARAIQNSALVYAPATLTGSTYEISLTPAVTSLQTGQVFHFRAAAANAGACSLRVNATTAYPINKNFDQALAANDIKAGQLVSVMYDGTNLRYQMISQLGNPPASGAAPGTVILLHADETNASNVNVSYSPCNTGTSSGTLKTYSLPANAYSRIIAEAEGFVELGANGGGAFNTGTVTITLPSGTSETFTARRQISVGGDTGDNGWRFPFTLSTSGASTSSGNLTVTGSLSLQGCTGGRIQINSLRVYGVQ